MNSEHRTENVVNQQYPTNMLNNLRMMARCCSFCRIAGHTITTCNDNRLINFEDRCVDKKIEFEHQENSLYKFKQWILQTYLEEQLLVKSFAIRNCGCRLRSNVQECIDRITNYFYPDVIAIGVEADADFIPFGQPAEDEVNQQGRLISALMGLMMLEIYDERRAQLINDIILNRNIIDTERYRKFDIESIVIIEEDNIEEIIECGICYDVMERNKFVKLNCGHEFCKDCLKQTFIKCSYGKNTCCSYCRAEIKKIVSRNNQVKLEFDDLIL
jgi:hypothetical protein